MCEAVTPPEAPVDTPAAPPGADGSAPEGAPTAIGRESLAALSGCGVLSGALFLGCFPLLTLVVGVALWWLPATKLMQWGRPPAIDLLDDLAMAQERWAGANGGAYAAASACPPEVPGEVPVAFPGDCTQPWTDLDLAWTDLPCRLSVELPESGSFLASAECGEELWQASEGRGPHRVQPGE